jgi:membrane-bound lytic murein transglycosylase D
MFKFASRNFYSEFLAALRVARRLEKDPSIIKDRPWASATLRLQGYALARDLRKYFGVSQQDFSRLNPALLKPALASKKYVPKGYLLRLPATKRIRQRIDKFPSRLLHRRQVRDKMYTVKKGDTVSSIARKYKISRKKLARANRLNRRSTIRRGQKLKIPSQEIAAAGSRSPAVVILKATAKHKP